MNEFIIRKVNHLVNKYKTNNPFEIAEHLNIIINRFPLNKEVKGFYTYWKKNKFIFINSNLEEYKQKFICAHELGHAIFHPKDNIFFLKRHTDFSIGKIEKQANQFAIKLLTINNEYICETQAEYSCRYGIPNELLEEYN